MEISLMSSQASLPDSRLVYHIADIMKGLGISRRTLERLRATGEFPAPTKMLGRCPVWSRPTVDKWLGGK
jgi:predicted DNA-binding transcriptional regulator AlpA